MSTIINATTTNGVVIQPDNSGSLVLQTNNGTTALTIDTSQNITTTNKLSVASMPTGSVVQVVQATYSTAVSNSTGSYADTGLTASITPSSSSNKILIIANQMGVRKINDTGVNFNLCRDGVNINNFVTFVAGTSSATEMDVGSCVFTYLDSPSTTSSITFKTQFLSRSGIAAVSVQYLTATSTMTLMEIKG